jgi:hypothetical protein
MSPPRLGSNDLAGRRISIVSPAAEPPSARQCAATNERGERLIWLEAAMAKRLSAMRGPGESYSDVILRLATVGYES